MKVARIAAREGVPSVLLKGSARRAAAALYPYADARDTLDIDLLVPEACARPLWECLRSAGYEVMVELPPGHFHLDPLSRPGGVAVEIHTSTSLRIPPEEAWRRAASDGDVVEHDGLGLKVPSATELLWHGVAHGVHQGAAGFRLRFLLDAAAVCASGRAVDWDLIGERLGKTGGPPKRNDPAVRRALPTDERVPRKRGDRTLKVREPRPALGARGGGGDSNARKRDARRVVGQVDGRLTTFPERRSDRDVP